MSITQLVPALTERLPEFLDGPGADEAAEMLHETEIVLIGSGSVGTAFAVNAAHLQPGKLTIADPAVFKGQSLLTSDITPDAVGCPKAPRLAARCREITPRTQVTGYQIEVQRLPASVFADADIVVLASDNLPGERFVAHRCRQFGIPLLQAAVSGESLVAQVRCLSNARPDGPCLVCNYNAVQWQLHDAQARLSCSGENVGQGPAATRSAAFLCTLAGALAVNQLTRRVLSLGQPADNQLVSYCGYTNRIMVSGLRRNPECRDDHAPWIAQAIDGPLAGYSVAGLLLAAGVPPDSWPHASLAIAGWGFGHQGRCQRCGHDQQLHRLIADNGPGPLSACCRAPLVVAGFFLQREIPTTVLPPSLPLRACGADRVEEVAIHDGTHRWLLYDRNN